MDITQLRGEIDQIDDQLVQLFCQRMQIASKIAQYKKENNLPIFVPAREQEKLADVASKAGPEMAYYTRSLYTSLFELSRDFQSKQNETKKCGLLGRKLQHSYSPQIHAQLGDYSYQLFEVEPENIADFLQNGSFSALNVTIPYKKAVIPYCANLSDRAKQLGAVNTIIKNSDGTLTGHNTDYYGFSAMVQRSGLSVAGKKALVLGSGGASVTASAVLEGLGAEVIVISRSGENNYDNIHRHCDAALIVNATPVGMYPNTDCTPLDIQPFTRLEGVLDLIYNPARTRLLMDAEQWGLVAENGLWMLVAQAKESAEWFTGRHISDDVIAQIHDSLSLQMRNIVLIGMPGSGKSTIGAVLAEQLGRKFVDADAEIVAAAGKSIPEIFTESGEKGFRAIETQVLSQLGKQSGLVISTGGGCVTRSENYPLLHQNGTIFCLNRELDKLSTVGRPLSKAGHLEEMARIRKPLYEHFADHMVDNNGAAHMCVAQICEKLSGR